MKINSDLLNNDVPACGQVAETDCVTVCLHENADIKILFLGNSITRHEVAESIGWFGSWGMAASCEENDYAHTFVRRVQSDGKIVSYCIVNASEWEQSWSDDILPEKYTAARDFFADVVIVRLGENARLLNRVEKFMPHYERFIDFFTNESAQVIVTDLFWEYEPFDTAVKSFAARYDYAFVPLHDLGRSDEMKAMGKFKHAGVAAHPGDKGMEAIAERIYAAYKCLRN